MIPTASDVLRVAAKYIGYKEKKTNAQLDDPAANAGSANYTKFARDTKGFWGDKQGFEWCTTFVLFCFCEAADPAFPKGKEEAFTDAKKLQPYTKYGASCKWQTAAYQEAGRWSADPHVGDQAFFTRGHTGLVEKVTAKQITLIEGNSNNKVERHVYKWPNSNFSGFGRPRYAEAAEPTPPKEEQKPTAPVFREYRAKVTPSNGLNVRTGAGTSFAKLGALKCGTVVTVKAEKSGWGQITYNGRAGWICLTYVRRVAK